MHLTAHSTHGLYKRPFMFVDDLNIAKDIIGTNMRDTNIYKWIAVDEDDPLRVFFIWERPVGSTISPERIYDISITKQATTIESGAWRLRDEIDHSKVILTLVCPEGKAENLKILYDSFLSKGIGVVD